MWLPWSLGEPLTPFMWAVEQREERRSRGYCRRAPRGSGRDAMDAGLRLTVD